MVDKFIMSDEFIDILPSLFVYLFLMPPFVIVQVFDNDRVILIPTSAFNVILSCLLLDKEFKQVLKYDILVISRGQSGIDIDVVDTWVANTLYEDISPTRDKYLELKLPHDIFVTEMWFDKFIVPELLSIRRYLSVFV